MPRPRVHLVAMLALLPAWLAAGCGADDDPPAVVDAAPDATPDARPPTGALELGTAAGDGSGFIAVEDGAEVSLIPGAQSGFHVYINMRVRGVAGTVLVERTARRQRDGSLVFRGIRREREIPEEARADWWESPTADTAFMCPSPIGIQVYDEAIVFQTRLLLEDESVVAEDELVLLVRCPEEQQRDFCLSICAG
ncbi:hypothetical protein [Haliangium ochraceum]|uniref:Lipoprotein n=1 Tax=Haliangium ochraceum (strain DSM 14365 / JCM 11303 / SMP-2) TaxID=502025 RepID=D0LV16_HALO1|nr:hypothetical protein [Haliangium ochraceum]ACY15857.1 hypothetical protein Hoch_3355 [Haliangium ochraceum DSM 14365]